MAKSIMHNKEDGTCYLCMLLNHDYARRSGLQEHHVEFGTAGRKLSEKYGMKVYLCLQHHTVGPEAVHNNKANSGLLQHDAQKAFEKKYSHEMWMQVFGRDRTLPFDKISISQ